LNCLEGSVRKTNPTHGPCLKNRIRSLRNFFTGKRIAKAAFAQTKREDSRPLVNFELSLTELVYSFSNSKALCSAFTASFTLFSSIMTVILISEVVMSWMLMPAAESVLNMVAA